MDPYMPQVLDGVVDELQRPELDALLRRRAVENVQGSTETLQSIVRLVDQIESMPVGPDVKDDIQDALAALNEVRLTAYLYVDHADEAVRYTRPSARPPSLH